MGPIGRYKRKRNYTHPKKPRHANLTLAHRKKRTNTIKVVSYNIKFSKKINDAITTLAESPDLDHADIICLQEMDPTGVEKIAHALKYNYVYYPAVLHPRHGKDFGNAILTKWPIIDDEKIILPGLKSDKLQRIAVKATVKIRTRKIIIFSIHMKVFLKPLQRTKQIKKLIASVPKSAKYCIVAGDFNTFNKNSRKAILEPFLNAHFDLATDDIGWSQSYWYLLNKKTSLDHIYTKGLKTLRKGKIVTKKASDHLPIWAELK